MGSGAELCAFFLRIVGAPSRWRVAQVHQVEVPTGSTVTTKRVCWLALETVLSVAMFAQGSAILPKRVADRNFPC